MGGSFKGYVPQEQIISEYQSGDDGLAAENGYNIPVLASYGGMGDDYRNVYAAGMLGENGHSMYYTPGYDYFQQSAYCIHPQGPYMGTGATSYGGAHYGAVYHQVSPPVMQYYSPEQDGTEPDTKKVNSREAGHDVESKPGVPQAKSGYELGYKTSVPSESLNHWGVCPGPTNDGFYGSAAAYEYYTQQWHSSQHGFQPLPVPQDLGVHFNCVPPMQGEGPGYNQAFPRVYSALNTPGRVPKGSSVKGGFALQNWRAKEATKGKGDGVQSVQARGLAMDKLKLVPLVQEGYPLGMVDNNTSSLLNRNEYNKEDFSTSYEAAKFYVIKSYSEDDVHKSIKYSVWSSTPNGNKRLDEAYRTAQDLSASATHCRVFFFFSVNCSGQFCGVAEMVGPVDFNKNMDFWLQGKWNGCFLVKWHIIKDVPNGHFRHIILSNNENKPVTNSRDTQEVQFHQGLEMLKTFKYFPARTSLLDDFAFYDGRQKVLQERKLRQQVRQQVVRHQIKEKAFQKESNAGVVLSNGDKENVRPVKQLDITSVGAHVISNQSKESVKVEPDKAEHGKTEGEIPEVEDVTRRVADLKVNGPSDVKAVEVSQVCNCGPGWVSKVGEGRSSEFRVDIGGICKKLCKMEASQIGEVTASKSRGDNGGAGERVSKVEKVASKVGEPAVVSESRGDNGGTGERVSRGDNGGTGERVSKVGKEVSRSRVDHGGTGGRVFKVDKPASIVGEEVASKYRGGNGKTRRNMSSNNKLADTQSPTTGSNKSFGRAKGWSSGGVETPAAPNNRKDDMSRMVISYKKALLEGIAGKVVVLDQND